LLKQKSTGIIQPSISAIRAARRSYKEQQRQLRLLQSGSESASLTPPLTADNIAIGDSTADIGATVPRQTLNQSHRPESGLVSNSMAVLASSAAGGSTWLEDVMKTWEVGALRSSGVLDTVVGGPELNDYLDRLDLEAEQDAERDRLDANVDGLSSDGGSEDENEGSLSDVDGDKGGEDEANPNPAVPGSSESAPLGIPSMDTAAREACGVLGMAGIDSSMPDAPPQQQPFVEQPLLRSYDDMGISNPQYFHAPPVPPGIPSVSPIQIQPPPPTDPAQLLQFQQFQQLQRLRQQPQLRQPPLQQQASNPNSPNEGSHSQPRATRIAPAPSSSNSGSVSRDGGTANDYVHDPRQQQQRHMMQQPGGMVQSPQLTIMQPHVAGKPPAKKRGRKRKNPELTEEERALVRKLQNRESAKLSRVRRKVIAAEYEDQITELVEKNYELRDQVAALNSRLGFLQNLLTVHVTPVADSVAGSADPTPRQLPALSEGFIPQQQQRQQPQQQQRQSQTQASQLEMYQQQIQHQEFQVHIPQQQEHQQQHEQQQHRQHQQHPQLQAHQRTHQHPIQPSQQQSQHSQRPSSQQHVQQPHLLQQQHRLQLPQ
jgi:Basic region leucine zipper